MNTKEAINNENFSHFSKEYEIDPQAWNAFCFDFKDFMRETVEINLREENDVYIDEENLGNDLDSNHEDMPY